jgi:hypothetical protein
MPTAGTGYPDPKRYWGFLRLTLAEVFEVNDADDLVGELQIDLSMASGEEQLFFFHYEPLEVASEVTGSTLNSNMLDKYQRLVTRYGWKP